MLDLVLGHDRSTLAERLIEVAADGGYGQLLPDDENPTREDALEWIDELIREYHRLVPQTSPDAIALEKALWRVEERGVAVIFGEPAYDASEGAYYGHERAQSLPDAVGFCYSHVQDICRLAVGLPLYIGFASMAPRSQGSDAAVADAAVAGIVVEELRRSGFAPGWSGSADARIELAGLVWEKAAVAQPREPENPPAAAPPPANFWGRLRKRFGGTN